ncbi:MAG: RnfABCDGE type electron transport complex subunit G [candidate division WOR-3 bacterium]|jgi:electron transport complex protein RnfG
MKDNIVQIIKLFVVAVVSAFLLSYVYSVTKEPIEKAKNAEIMEAIKSIVPGISDQMIIRDTFLISDVESIPLRAYLILNPDSSIHAYSILSYTKKGYGGTITIMVGVDKDFKITGVYPLEFSETPGLGTKMTEKSFKDQFLSKSLSNFNFKVKNDGGDIQAITSATITSRAVGDCLERGLKVIEYNFKKEVSDSSKTGEVINE